MYKVFNRYTRKEAFRNFDIKPKNISNRHLCLKLSVKVPEKIFQEMKVDYRNVEKALYLKRKPMIKIYNNIWFRGHYACSAVALSTFIFLRHLAGFVFTSKISIRPSRIKLLEVLR